MLRWARKLSNFPQMEITVFTFSQTTMDPGWYSLQYRGIWYLSSFHTHNGDDTLPDARKLGCRNWRADIQDGGRWRRLLEEAKAHLGLRSRWRRRRRDDDDDDDDDILILKFLDDKLEDKRFCTEWLQAFPDFNLPLISSWIQFWFFKFVPKYWNYSIISKELLSIFILWPRPSLWSRYMTMYLLLPAFTSSPVSLLATTIVRTLPPNILTSTARTRSWYVQFNFYPSRFTWTLLIAYSKAKVKKNGDKASPCFKPFLIRNMWTKFLLYPDCAIRCSRTHFY